MSGIKYEMHKGERVAVVDKGAFRKEAISTNFESFLRASNIPKRYWELEFEDYQGTKSLQSVEQVQKFIEVAFESGEATSSLYLFGDRRCQKTMIACAAGKAFLRRGYSVQFAHAGDIGDMLMKTQGYSKDEKLNTWKQTLKGTDVLILDEAFDVNKTLMWTNSENKNLIVSEWDRLIRGLIAENKVIIAISNAMKSSIGTNFSRDLFELVDSEFLLLTFEDSIKDYRKQQVQSLLGSK